jgi:hypothetical protein
MKRQFAALAAGVAVALAVAGRAHDTASLLNKHRKGLTRPL